MKYNKSVSNALNQFFAFISLIIFSFITLMTVVFVSFFSFIFMVLMMVVGILNKLGSRSYTKQNPQPKHEVELLILKEDKI